MCGKIQYYSQFYDKLKIMYSKPCSTVQCVAIAMYMKFTFDFSHSKKYFPTHIESYVYCLYNIKNTRYSSIRGIEFES